MNRLALAVFRHGLPDCIEVRDRQLARHRRKVEEDFVKSLLCACINDSCQNAQYLFGGYPANPRSQQEIVLWRKRQLYQAGALLVLGAMLWHPLLFLRHYKDFVV